MKGLSELFGRILNMFQSQESQGDVLLTQREKQIWSYLSHRLRRGGGKKGPGYVVISMTLGFKQMSEYQLTPKGPPP